MDIKKAIIILISLFLIVGLFLGYIFFISRTDTGQLDLKTRSESINKENKEVVETPEEEEVIEEGIEREIVPATEKNIIINNLIKEEVVEEEVKNNEEIISETLKKTPEEEMAEKEKKVNDIKNLLLK